MKKYICSTNCFLVVSLALSMYLLVVFVSYRHNLDFSLNGLENKELLKRKAPIVINKQTNVLKEHKELETAARNTTLGNLLKPKEQIVSYIDAILEFNKKYPVKTVCEIGLGGEHIVSIFLSVTNTSFSFTKFNIQDTFTTEEIELVKEKYQEQKITVIRGNIKNTLRDFTDSCNIIHIDEPRKYQVELKSIVQAASKNNLLLIDDCAEAFPSVLNNLQKLESDNLVFGIKKYTASLGHDNIDQRGWCIGHYTKNNFVTFLDEQLCTPSWQGNNCDKHYRSKPCSELSDECFYNNQSGVLTVSCTRWHNAQKVEQATWDNKQRKHARNEEHADSYKYYKFLPNNLGNVIEIGAGPFTQTKTILKYHPVNITSVTLLEPMAFHYMLHAKYCFYPNGGFKNLPTTLLAFPAEELKLTRRFDTLVMINVIEHVYDALSILDRAIDLVSTGGLFIWHERIWDDYRGIASNKDDREFQLHPIRIKTIIAKLIIRMFDPVFETWDTAELRRLKNQGVYFVGRRNEYKARTNIPLHDPCFYRPKGKQTVVFFISMSNCTKSNDQIRLAERSDNTKRIILIMTEEVHGQAMSEIFQNKKIEIMLSYRHFKNWKEELSHYTTPCSVIYLPLTSAMLRGNETLCIGLKT